jgi:hypothetical protein
MKLFRWSLGNRTSSATLAASRPIIRQESSTSSQVWIQVLDGTSAGHRFGGVHVCLNLGGWTQLDSMELVFQETQPWGWTGRVGVCRGVSLRNRPSR